jgi:hypothetical protein
MLKQQNNGNVSNYDPWCPLESSENNIPGPTCGDDNFYVQRLECLKCCHKFILKLTKIGSEKWQKAQVYNSYGLGVNSHTIPKHKFYVQYTISKSLTDLKIKFSAFTSKWWLYFDKILHWRFTQKFVKDNFYQHQYVNQSTDYFKSDMVVFQLLKFCKQTASLITAKNSVGCVVHYAVYNFQAYSTETKDSNICTLIQLFRRQAETTYVTIMKMSDNRKVLSITQNANPFNWYWSLPIKTHSMFSNNSVILKRNFRSICEIYFNWLKTVYTVERVHIHV